MNDAMAVTCDQHRSPESGQHFTNIYGRYKPLVVKFIRVLGRPGDISEDDIVQDIFLRLWLRNDHLSEIRSMEDFLFLMVKNRLINENEHRMVKQKAFSRISGRSTGAANYTEEELNRRHVYRVWQQGTSLLSARAGTAYKLKEIACLDNEAIACRMKVSVSAVKEHLRMANKQVKAYMDSQGCY